MTYTGRNMSYYRSSVLIMIRGWVNNYPQRSCTCVSLGSTFVFACIARRGFLLVTTVQVWSCSVSSFVPTVTLTMAVPLSVCTKEEQRSVIRFLWSEGVSGAEIHRRLSAQYGNRVLPQRGVYEWIEKFKKWSHNCYAWRKRCMRGSLLGQKHLFSEGIKEACVNDGRSGLKSTETMLKNDVIISFLFLLK